MDPQIKLIYKLIFKNNIKYVTKDIKSLSMGIQKDITRVWYSPISFYATLARDAD
jgi:hypothetical protein